MKQSWAMCLGAALGAVGWLLFRSSPSSPSAFLSIVIAALIAVGIYGVARAELTLAGRGGKSPKKYTGLSARLIGFIVIATALAFAFLMAHVSR
jgi:sulfite exporter TauE/SafE